MRLPQLAICVRLLDFAVVECWDREALRVTAMNTHAQCDVKPALETQGIDQVPSDVSRIADAAGMGRLRHAQNAMTPAKTFLLGLAFGIAAIGATYALAWYANETKIGGDSEGARQVATVALVVFLAGVFFILSAIRSIFSGRRSAYLYDNGVVWRRNRKIEAVPWSRMTELVRWRVGGNSWLTGTLLHYIVVTAEGLRLMIDRYDAKGDESFGARLEEAVRQRGGRIVDDGSFTQSAPPLLPLPGTIVWVLLGGCVLAVGALLDKLQMPENTVLSLATLPLGLIVMAIELRTRRPLGPTTLALYAPFGTFITLCGGLILALTVGMTQSRDMGLAVLGIEIVLAIAAAKMIKACWSRPR